MGTVRLEQLKKTYPGNVVALNDVSFTVNSGEFMTLLGPPKSGKSTLLRLISGAEPLAKGAIYIDDQPQQELRPNERDVALVFQNYALYPHLSVYKNLTFALELRGTPPQDIKKQAAQAAHLLKLNPILKSKPGKLTDEERQRVVLGRAVAQLPAVYLFDDPFHGLDAPLRQAMCRLLTALHHQLDATFIYATQDPAEAMALGERAAVINRGRIEQVATPKAIQKAPASYFVAQLVSRPTPNFLRATLRRTDSGFAVQMGDDVVPYTAAVPPQALAPYVNRPVWLAVSPAAIRDDNDFLRKYPERLVTATVEISELIDGRIYIYLHYNGAPLVAQINQPDSGYRTGSRAVFGIDTANATLYDAETGLAIR